MENESPLCRLKSCGWHCLHVQGARQAEAGCWARPLIAELEDQTDLCH